MAMLPRLIRLKFMPSRRMVMKPSSTPMGSIRIATRALRTCSRNTTQTSATMTDSSIRVLVSVSMAR
jgi:hypothetical protein